uniref:Uncharacterized protein n=1 Tax=Kalanchoe fedtschenkoi TaxID=63787 RepID=A0A7N0SWA0_KALFE
MRHTMPSATTQGSTGSATPSTSTGSSEDSPPPERKTEVSEERDTATTSSALQEEQHGRGTTPFLSVVTADQTCISSAAGCFCLAFVPFELYLIFRLSLLTDLNLHCLSR